MRLEKSPNIVAHAISKIDSRTGDKDFGVTQARHSKKIYYVIEKVSLFKALHRWF
jgi:hypothetical protein